MNYKIVEREEIKLVGMTEKIVMPSNAIHYLWENFTKRCDEVDKVINKTICYGVADNMLEANTFDETVAYEVSEFTNIPEGMITKIIPKQKYLVFTHVGAIVGPKGEQFLSKTYENIYSKIIPTLEFEVDNTFNFELYDDRFSHALENSEFDIYVPIKE